MEFVRFVAILSLVCCGVTSQSVATCGSRDTTTYKTSLLRNLLDVTTQHFSENSVGDDGVSRIDASLIYNLPDLFALRYGEGASTASYLAGFFDILYADVTSYTDSDASEHLAKIIGLLQLGEFEAARIQTGALIYATLPDGFVPFDVDDVTDSQNFDLSIAIQTALNSVRQAISPSIFELYLNLKVGSTLSFAIDTTGSMRGEIEAAKNRIENIIDSTRGTIQQPLLYVLSPFNDPGSGPVTVTAEPDVIIAALAALSASGGGDFPELALIGTQNAIISSTKRSVVFIITDAAAKDVELTSRVIALAIIRKVRIISLLTQNIGGTNGFVLYDRISSASGGLVTVTDKADIGSITELFTILTAQGQVKLEIRLGSSIDVIPFSIDSRLSDVTIILSTQSGSYDDVRDSDGNSLGVVPVVDAMGLVILRLPGDLHVGEYTIHLSGTLKYSLEIAGQSTFGAIPTIFENVGGNYVHRLQTRAGQPAHISARLFGNFPSESDLLTSTNTTDAILQEVQIIDQNGTLILSEAMTSCGENEFRTNNELNIPDSRFFIKLIGVDRHGMRFARVDACAVTPLVSNFELSEIDDQTVDVDPTAPTTITVTSILTNNEATSTFTFDASDPRGFVSSVSPVSATVDSNFNVTITIVIPVGTSDKTISQVTLTATPDGSDEFVFIIFNVAVRDSSAISCPAFVSPAGSVITCDDFNNEGSVCTLKCEAGYITRGASRSICQSNQTWTHEELRCDFVGFQQCQVTGDPHYTTFDGRRFDFQGTCIYTTVQTTFNETIDGLEPFSVQVANEHLGGVRRVSWFKQAYVEIYNVSIVFLKGRRLRVNGLSVTPPFSVASKGLRIFLSGQNIIMTTTIGLEITYNGGVNFFVRLSAAYADRVEGLCGNINGNPSDDLVLSFNKSIPASPNDFGNSYTSGGLGCAYGSDGDGKGDCLDERDYEALCDIVNGGCFATCRESIPTTGVLENCVFDMCVTEGDGQALEESIAEYAGRCQRGGISICDWRDLAGITVPCPSNSHYEHEGKSCPNTCQFQTQATRCARPDVSGCVCNEGFVLSGSDCVPLTECGCTARGRYYKNGEDFYEEGCTSLCACSSGRLQCIATSCGGGEICKISDGTRQLTCEPASFAQCDASGDPHYKTFDGRRYDFQGGCNYLLMSTHSASDGLFTINGENEARNGNNRVTWIKSITIEFRYNLLPVQVHLGRFVNGNPAAQITGVYESPTVTEAFEGTRFSVHRSGTSIIAKIRDVSVRYSASGVFISVPGRFANQVTGLCGNFNGNATDDFTTSDGTFTSDVNVFGTSYQVGNCTAPSPPDPFVCSPSDTALYGGGDQCGKITADPGQFANCGRVVDLTLFYDDCLYDLCANGGGDRILTEAISYVAHHCQVLGEGNDLCDWRRLTSSPLLDCPANSHYEGCMSACPNTCLRPFASESCATPDIEGCQCNFGYIWNEGECVRSDECGCYTVVYGYVKQGFSKTDGNCTRRCACNGPNRWECEDITCDDEEICTKVGTSYQCLPPVQTCILWGSTYVSTFDKKQFNFDGNCTYILAASHGDDAIPEFSVVVEKTHVQENGLQGYKIHVAMGALSVDGTRYDGLVATITPNGKDVYVNGLRLLYGTHTPVYTILKQGTFTVISFSFGLTIRSSSHFSGLMVTIPGRLQNNVAGLCGVFDGNPDNDFIINEDGASTSDPVVFGNAWKYTGDGVNEKCTDGRSPPDDPMNPTCRYDRYLGWITSVQSCGKLLDATSHYGACHSIVPPQPITTFCVTHACHLPYYLDILEHSLIGYRIICTIRGFLLEAPTGLLGITMRCPENSRFTSSIDPCAPTCGDPDGSNCRAKSELAGFPFTEGCTCDEGYVWDVDRCVSRDMCGCVAPGYGFYIQHGQCLWNEDCSEKCQCRNGEWNCESDSCYSNQRCGLRDGEYGCHYEDECRYDNGGCSHECTSANSSVSCACPSGMLLLEDSQTCRKLDDGACTGRESECVKALAEWKTSYLDWRHHYYNQYITVFEAYNNGEKVSAILRDFPDSTLSGGSACNTSWSEWFDTDNATGCGDDETIQRINNLYPNSVCKTPLAMESRIVDGAACASDGSQAVLREESPEVGLLCDNSDQITGNDCPDYEVRFLCQE